MFNFLYNLATDKYRGLSVSLLKALLWFLSLIYGVIVRGVIFISGLNPHRLNCKTVSVGNITLGGTGKTSLVEFIARYLRQKGEKVAIISRGYKRPAISYSPVASDYAVMGDEPYMLKTILKDVPVLVDIDRMRAGRMAISEYRANIVILDDGFQQWKIKKDLEIVTVDATNPFGNRHLLPRGILRQPLSSLKCAEVIVLTKTNINPEFQDIKYFLSSLNPGALIVESIHQPAGFYKIGQSDELLKPEGLTGKAVTLFSGIADPASFEKLIVNLGATIGLSFRFPDHHCYSQRDLENIIQRSEERGIDTIVTTEKDAVRLSQLSTVSCRLSVLVLRIELKITNNEERFYNRLLSLYSL